jgi:hypothetical protein
MHYLRLILLGAVCALLMAGCAGKEAYQAHGQYLDAATAERPMFRLTTQPGEQVTITGIASLELFYPGQTLQPFQDTTAQAWAPVVGGVFSTAIPVLGMWGQAYTLSRHAVKMAPFMGEGNVQVNQSSVGGQQDLRLASPDSTHEPTVVNPVVVPVPAQ